MERFAVFEKVVRQARSATGPDGVPYGLYKHAPDVLQILRRLIRVAWMKQFVSIPW